MTATTLTNRQTRLLEVLRARNGAITTGHVRAINAQLGAPKRTTARRDIAALRRHRLLTENTSADGQRYYQLTQEEAA